MAGVGSPAVWRCGMRAIVSRAASRLTGLWPWRRTALALLVASLVGPAYAVQPDEVLQDPALERRARDISAELRCLVCQNQSIDDSDAPLAKDLRVLVRERLKAGDNDADVRDFVVQRYGEFVLLKPSFGLHTALLWLGPVLILGAGALSLIVILRRRHANVAAPLSADERAALDKLLRRDRPPP
jgi:cytochrome c-type biogenesis protein CcmH